jgi:ribosome-associated protein
VIGLDLRTLSSFTDYFLICHGRNRRQVQAISDHIEATLREHKIRPKHIEGYQQGEWILLDYSDFIIHVFIQERREALLLEKLWGDAPRLEFPGEAAETEER